MIEYGRAAANVSSSMEQSSEETLVTDTSKAERGRVTHLLEENMRLQAKQSQLLDQLADLRCQILAEKSARQGLEVELGDVKSDLLLTKDQLDRHKKEKGDLSLKLCTMTAQRDELESRLGEAWGDLANLQESAKAKDAANKSLHDTIERERREQDAQNVMMQAMVSQLSTLEQQVATGCYAEEQQRHANEDTWRAAEEEILRFSHALEELADTLDDSLNIDDTADCCQELLQLQPYPISGALPDAGIIVSANSGLNVSHRNEPCRKASGRLFGPIYYALRYLQQKLQDHRKELLTSRQEQRILEAHVASLKEEVEQLNKDGDSMRERLMKSEAQRAQAEALLQELRNTRNEETAHALDTRSCVAKLLGCVDDWFVIEQCVSDSVQEMVQLRHTVEENRRLHEQYVRHKEEEIDGLVEAHQREVDMQSSELEQIRRECERHKRAVAAITSNVPVPSIAGVTVTSASEETAVAEVLHERDAFKLKYDDLQRYVETELEPLLVEQNRAVKREKQRVEELCRLSAELKLEMKLFRGVCNECNRKMCGEGDDRCPSTFEALVLALRVLSGAVKDMQEVLQQRKALMRYAAAYERVFGPLNRIAQPARPHPLLRFRSVIIVVIAVNRLVVIFKASWHQSCGSIPYVPRGDTVLPVSPGFMTSNISIRIRLPRETHCIAHGGVVSIPFQCPAHIVEEEQVTHHMELGGQTRFVVEQELWEKIQLPRPPHTVVGAAATQSYVLRSLMDSLISFVTIPAVPTTNQSLVPDLWQGLARGLAALRMAPHTSLEPKEEQHRLIHLSPVHQIAGGNYTPHSCSWINDDAMMPDLVVPFAEDREKDCDYLGCRRAKDSPAPVLPPSYVIGSGSAEGSFSGGGPGVYPVPQPNSVSVEGDETLEGAVRQSLMRDIYECNGLKEEHLGEGFAAHILNVIQALDQRVMGALERRPKIGGRRPCR